MRYILTLMVLASPAYAAAGKPFFSLANTDFIVSIGFLIFIGILVYFKVPALLMGLLDKRAEDIRTELDEARALREEAQSLLASYDRKIREAQAQAEEIVDTAKREAEASAEQAKTDLKASVERRMAAAADQIESAKSAAIKEVRDRAIAVATSVAADVVAKQISTAQADTLIDESIDAVATNLH